MKTKFTIAILALCMMFAHTNPLNAQNEIIIGDGSYQTIQLGILYHPENKFSRTESVYPKTAFSSPCIIQSIAFYNKFAWPVQLEKLNIYMGEKFADNYAALTDYTPLEDLTLVYSTTDYTLGASLGWQDLTMDTPFCYEHVGNLVVVFAAQVAMPNIALAYRSRWKCSLESQNVTVQWTDNGDASLLERPTRKVREILPHRVDIKMVVSSIEINCRKPQLITVTGRSNSSIGIEWLPYEGTSSWDVYISDGNTSSPVVVGLSSPNYTFTGLNSNTSYLCHVRTNCGDEVSSWRSIAAFTEPNFIGEGTEEAPYLLYSTTEIEELSQALNHGWETQGKHFKVMRDIATVTEPIQGMFCGRFDGDGHTITLNMTTQSEQSQALFLSIGPGAYITDLTVEGTIHSALTGNFNSAGIVALNNMSSLAEGSDTYIVNCVNKVDIENVYNSNFNCIGGIIGSAVGSQYENGPHPHIINCTNKGCILGHAAYQGGIAGWLGNGVIDGCENQGDMDCRYLSGGIAAYCRNNGHIRNCCNSGSIIADILYHEKYLGGIVGYFDNSQILNCYNVGRVEAVDGATANARIAVGGIAGYCTQSSELRNVYNAGWVVSEVEQVNKGALVGMFYQASNCILEGAYYRDGSCRESSPMRVVSNNVCAFTQDTLNPLVCTLDTLCYGSTDLRTALNNWREGNPDYKEWLEDVYGNNGYFPTFDAGRPPGLEITPDPLSLGHRPIGARVRSEELMLSNTGTSGLDIMAVEIANASFVVLDETVWDPEMPIQLGGGQSLRVGVTTDPEATVGEGTLESPLVVVWDGRSATMATVTATAYVPETPDVVETALEVDSFPFTTVQVTSDIYDNYNLPGAHVDGPDAVYKLTFDREMVLNAAMATGSQPKLALYKEEFGGKGYPDVDNAYTGPAIGPGNFGPISEWLHYDDGEYVTTIGTLLGGELYWGIQFPASTLAAYEGCWLSKVMIYNADQSGTVNLMLYTGGVMSPGTLVATQEVTFTGSNRWEEIELETPIPLDVSRNLWICCSSETPYIASACDYVEEPNSCWVSLDGSSNNWTILTQHGLPYSWMIRGLVTNQRSEEERMMRSTEGVLSDITVIPGTYYLVASCTAAEYALEINPTEIPLPMAANVIAPVDGAMEVPVPVTLRWKLGAYTTEYQLLFGTSYPPTEVVVDWTPDLAESYRTSILRHNTQYFWRVNARNGTGTVASPVWGFTTLLDVPQHLTANSEMLYVGDVLQLNWRRVSDDRLLRGYNLYQDNVRVNETPITATQYSIEGLEYNMAGYRYHVTAVYDEGESANSNAVYVKISGEGAVQGRVYEQDHQSGIGGATVTLKGHDEHGLMRSFSFVTDEEGAYGGPVLAGQYTAFSASDGYANSVYEGLVEVPFSECASDIDIVMKEEYRPVSYVEAEAIDDARARLQWSVSPMPISEWLHYDDGNYVGSVGAGGTFHWGVRFPDMWSYASSQLTKVAYFDAVGPGTVTLNIHLGGVSTPQSLVWSQEIQVTGSGSMVVVELDAPVDIDGTQSLWITCRNSGIDHPAAGSDYCGDKNSCLISVDGVAWDYLTNYNLYYSWMLRGFVTNERGEIVSIEDSHRAFSHYNVYRTDGYNEVFTPENTELVATGLTDTVIMDHGWGTLDPGVYKWGVSRVYEGNRMNLASERRQGKKAYAYSHGYGMYPTGWISYDLNDPSSYTLINPNIPELYGGDYCGDGNIYAFTGDNCFVNIDCFTGEIKSSVPIERRMTDCAYDITSGTLYGVFNSSLYTIDLTSGTSTLVCHEQTTPLNMLACDAQGQLYGIMNNGSLCWINKFNAQVDEIGYTGQPSYFANSGGFDHQSGRLYWPYFSYFYNYYTELDLTTGWAMIIASQTGWQSSWCTPFDMGYGFYELGESPIVWSNRLDKDMTTALGLTVALESGENPSGTKVKLTNLSEPSMGFDMEVTLDETGHCQWDEFRKGVYSLSITHQGFKIIYVDSLSIWQASSLQYILEEIKYDVGELHVSTTGWAQWKDRDILSGWLYYDDGNYIGSLGGDNISWGIMIPDTCLTEYSGCSLSQVAIYVVFAGTYHLSIYHGGSQSPGELVWTQTEVLDKTNRWCYVDLDRLVPINTDQNLWIVFNNSDARYCASACLNTGNPNGRWASTDGVNWTDIASHGHDLTWMIRGWVSNEWRGEAQEIGVPSGNNGSPISANIKALPKPGDLQFQANDNAVPSAFDYTMPQRSLQHFKVMLDGVFCGDVTEPYCQHEVEGMVEGSTHTTSVAAVYSTGFSEWVEYEWTYTPCDQYEGVEAFNVEVINDQVLLSWEGLSARESTDGDLGGQWLYYDNGENITGVGTDPASSFYWGVMFPKSLLGGYNHHQLTKVSMFDAEAHSGTIRIYQGGDYAPLTLLHEEEYEGNGSMEYVEYSLSEALSIDATLNLWVVMNNQDGQYVASCGANTGNRNGRWISTDGVTWYDAASLGLEFTWNLRAYLEEETYSDSVLGTMVYRDGTLLTPEPMTGTTYLDATPEIGDHTYCIRVVHGNPGWPMEHDWYAMSCAECAMVDVTGVGTHEAGQVKVYPNPSLGELTLEAEGMRRVEVSNTLGQRVYDRELRSDHHRMDLSGLAPGVYTVTVTSAIGTTTHRVVLMR